MIRKFMLSLYHQFGILLQSGSQLQEYEPHLLQCALEKEKKKKNASKADWPNLN